MKIDFHRDYLRRICNMWHRNLKIDIIKMFDYRLGYEKNRDCSEVCFGKK